MDPITVALIITSATSLATTLLLPLALATSFLIKNIKKSSCCSSSLETRLKPIITAQEEIKIDVEDLECNIEQIKSVTDLYHD